MSVVRISWACCTRGLVAYNKHIEQPECRRNTGICWKARAAILVRLYCLNPIANILSHCSYNLVTLVIIPDIQIAQTFIFNAKVLKPDLVVLILGRLKCYSWSWPGYQQEFFDRPDNNQTFTFNRHRLICLRITSIFGSKTVIRLFI